MVLASGPTGRPHGQEMVGTEAGVDAEGLARGRSGRVSQMTVTANREVQTHRRGTRRWRRPGSALLFALVREGTSAQRTNRLPRLSWRDCQPGQGRATRPGV